MPSISPAVVERLAEYAAQWTGFAPGAIRREQIRRGAERLLGQGATPEQLLARAGAADPEIVGHFCDTISVGETYFFRNPEQFRFVAEEVVPALLRSRPPAIRCWSAGCATGEEAYSLAAAVLGALPPSNAPAVEVLGTDLLARNVEAARRARYEAWSIRPSAGPLPPSLLEPEGGGAFRTAPEIRAHTSFRRHNLLGPPPSTRAFDVVFCRNVLVYLSPSAAEAVCANLTAALAPGGVLVVGAIELDRPPPGTEPAGPPELGAFRLAAARPNVPARAEAAASGSPVVDAARHPVGVTRPAPVRPPGTALAVAEPVAVHLKAIDLIERGLRQAASGILAELCRTAPDYLPGLLEQALLWTHAGQPRRAADRMREILERTADLPAETPVVGPEKLPLAYYRASAEAYLRHGRPAPSPGGDFGPREAAGKGRP